MSGIPTPNVEVQWASDAPDAPDEADLRAWAVKAVAVAGGVERNYMAAFALLALVQGCTPFEHHDDAALRAVRKKFGAPYTLGEGRAREAEPTCRPPSSTIPSSEKVFRAGRFGREWKWRES